MRRPPRGAPARSSADRWRARTWPPAAPRRRIRARSSRRSPCRCPARMIDVLLSPSFIPAGCLDMTVRFNADPNILPGRRNMEVFEPCEKSLILYKTSLGSQVTKTSASWPPLITGSVLADINQRRFFSGNDGGCFHFWTGFKMFHNGLMLQKPRMLQILIIPVDEAVLSGWLVPTNPGWISNGSGIKDYTINS